MASIIPAPQDAPGRYKRFSGARLLERRRAAALSREQVAVAIARSGPSVKLYELGRVVPPGPVLANLAGVLGCRIDDLFEEREVREP